MEKKMTRIMSCEVEDCLYNESGECRTFAITVGGREPCCDTFMHGSAEKGGVANIEGGVGACHVDRCVFNNRYECSIESINVGLRNGDPDCLTFRSRSS